MKDVDIFFFYELCSLLSQTLLIVKKLFEKQNLKLYFANCKNKNCILLISQNFLNIPMQKKHTPIRFRIRKTKTKSMHLVFMKIGMLLKKVIPEKNF
jgi:hypothetical protein